MRRDRIRGAHLYINAKPCLGDNGCDENIESVLPAGYSLIVYCVEKGCTTTRVYEGTGEGLDP